MDDADPMARYWHTVVPLPSTVAPGQSVDVSNYVTVPSTTGNYTLLVYMDAAVHAFASRILNSPRDGYDLAPHFNFIINSSSPPPSTTGATLAIQNSQGTPNSVVEVPILLSAGQSQVAGLQWKVGFDATALTYNSVRSGSTADNSGKSVTANMSGGQISVLVAGLNQNLMSDGIVAYLMFVPTSNLQTGTSTSLSCNAAQGTNPSGGAVPVSCSSGRITGGSACSCDVNRDGTVNVADVQLVINHALGVSAFACDINGDNTINIGDVQIVINSALGLGCNR
jgi:hypothetical protein